jgi:hypothetical protein
MAWSILICIFLSISTGVLAEEVSFTLEDRDRLIRMEATLKEFKDSIDKRFDQMTQFLYILAGIFTSLVVAVIGFAYWDRRTIIREARREAIEFMEKEGMLRRILDALRELSREDTRLAEALRRFNLL